MPNNKKNKQQFESQVQIAQPQLQSQIVIDNTNNNIEIDRDLNISLIRLQLKNIRKGRHISRAKMSQLTGLSLPSINHMEDINYPSTPTLKTLMVYLNALDYTLYIKDNNDPIDIRE